MNERPVLIAWLAAVMAFAVVGFFIGWAIGGMGKIECIPLAPDTTSGQPATK